MNQQAARTVPDRVNQVLIDILGQQQSDITLEHSLEDDLGADSLDIVEIVMALEEEFETEISDDQAEAFTTVQSIVDFFQEP